MSCPLNWARVAPVDTLLAGRWWVGTRVQGDLKQEPRRIIADTAYARRKISSVIWINCRNRSHLSIKKERNVFICASR